VIFHWAETGTLAFDRKMKDDVCKALECCGREDLRQRVAQLDVPTQAAPNSDAAGAPALEEPDAKQRPLSSFFGVRKVSKATAAAHDGVDLD